MTYPGLGIALFVLACLLCAGLAVLPASPWFAPETVPCVRFLSTAWMLWRLWVLDRAWATYRAWTRNTSWILSAEALAQEEGR